MTVFNFLSALYPKVLRNKIIRFFIVSGINTLFGYGLFALLIFIHTPYPVAALIGTIIGILFNFKTIGVLVFNNRRNGLIFRFFGVYGITYLFNIAGLALLKYYGMNLYFAGAILLFPAGLLGFYLHRSFVFNQTRKV
jgi:putative flippase GtrA